MKYALAAAATALLIAPGALATEIDVSYSPTFEEALQDDYGVREGTYLIENVKEDLMREFAKSGLEVDHVTVTIERAMPNKPTMKQLGDRMGLDYGGSVSIGGMELSATAYDASGAEMGSLTYDWFETDIRNAGVTTWGDAKRASDRFARKFAKALQEAT
ncbi:hypothetical protein [Hyphomonas sp.]|uniref:hypothetical protein n=1 Tax=Hyphomonas sp. TaxID=87 RepID=UPI0030FA1083